MSHKMELLVISSWIYSGLSNFERFDVRTTWNSTEEYEENPILKL
jgi:hypothetical protein